MEVIFTEHAKERLEKRKITKEEVIIAIKNPEKIVKRHGKYYAKKNIGRANIEVIFEKEKYIKVITAYYV